MIKLNSDEIRLKFEEIFDRKIIDFKLSEGGVTFETYNKGEVCDWIQKSQRKVY